MDVNKYKVSAIYTVDAQIYDEDPRCRDVIRDDLVRSAALEASCRVKVEPKKTTEVFLPGPGWHLRTALGVEFYILTEEEMKELIASTRIETLRTAETVARALSRRFLSEDLPFTTA